MSKAWAQILRWLAALAVLVFLPASNVLLLMRPEFVSFEYSRPGFPPASRFSAQTRLHWAQESVRYLLEPDDAALMEQGRHISQFQEAGELIYNEREVQHMVDVKTVLRGLTWAWRIAGLVLLAGAVWALARRPWRRPFLQGTLLGSVLLVGLLVAILLSAWLSFDVFFTRFHQVFFSGDSWLFSYDDSLIQFYPLPLWIDATFILGALSLVEGLALGAASLLGLKRSQGRP